MKKLIIILSIIIIGLTVSWYFDIWNEPVRSIDELIGQNYDYAHKMYFQSDPDGYYTINVNGSLNEFDGGILNKKETLTDTIVHVYTWEFMTHKKTIWIGRTENLESQVIDANRYSNSVQFWKKKMKNDTPTRYIVHSRPAGRQHTIYKTVDLSHCNTKCIVVCI